MHNILSFGAGVQSTTLFLMACKGELPKFDAAIFADTGYEPAAVYAHLEAMRQLGEAHGIPLAVVRKGNLFYDISVRVQSTCNKRSASIPFFTKSPEGQLGIARRQCTSEYKIEPIKRFIRREILGLRPRQPAPKTPVVNQFIGISLDETDRIRESGEPWRVNQYPLCNYPERWLPREFTRRDCLDWIQQHFPEVHPPTVGLSVLSLPFGCGMACNSRQPEGMGGRGRVRPVDPPVSRHEWNDVPAPVVPPA